ncbi:hypothetical protein [Frondihabitans sp. Leaf304]|uniref:hypothetical protein n=1 Tax=Frondihabitans sp. Leaf304 TaxID=1736329 RepID=UPI0006FAF413|nr:hypothetical protein [Frondihabitans sp. Leaf304]KQQ28785.1 hypothetical protein ASF54_09155 [Frondihabitans sp. Leaf304]
MNIAKTGAAFGLAALTLASSLSLGAAANAAPSTPTANDTPQVEGDHLLIPYVVRNADGTYFGAKTSVNQRSRNGTLQEALAYADKIQVPRPGVTGKLLSEDGSRCLFVGSSSLHYRYLQAGGISGSYCTGPGTTYANAFQVSGDGTLTESVNPSFRILVDNRYSQVLYQEPAADETPSRLLLLNAETTSVDVYNRTAMIKGYANPGARVMIGAKEIFADPTTGEWTTTVRNLEIGENTFEMEQFDGDESLGKSSFIVDVKTTPLSFKVTATSIKNNSADVEITGTPGASVEFQGSEISLGRTGTATATVRGLALGGNDVTFEQWIDSKSVGGPKTFTIMMTIADLTVDAAFGANNNEDVILSGKAESAAHITVLDENGDKTETDADPRGNWSTPVKAPGAGIQTFEVFQTIGDANSLVREVDVNYGNPVEILTPRDNTDTDGGTLHFTGEGQSLANIGLYENGTRLASFQALNSGNWSHDITGVKGDYKHTYTARMLSKGNLTTEETITVNPDKPEEAEAAKFDLTNPKDGEDVTLADGKASLEGTARAGADVQVIFGGNVVGSATASDTNTWQTLAALPTGTHNVRFKVTAAGQPVENHYRTITVKAEEGTSFELTNPKDGGEISQVNGLVDFTGKAKKNTSVEIWAGGKAVATGLTGDTETWTAKGASLPVGTQLVRAKVNTNGVIQNVFFTITVKAEEGVTFELTNPKDGGEVTRVNGLVDFTGKAKKNTSVEIWSGGTVVATGLTGDTETWTAKGANLPVGSHLLRAKVNTNGVMQNVFFTVTVKAEQGVTFELTNPKDGGEVTQVNGLVDFTGKAPKNTSVEIWSGGTVVATGLTGDTEAWTAKGAKLPVGAQMLRAKVNTNGAVQNVFFTVTVNEAVGTIQDFELTTPGADGHVDSFVQNGTNLATFTGLGTTGGHVEIWTTGNMASDRLVAMADVDSDGNWQATGGISNWTWNLEVRYTLGGTTTVTPFTATIAAPAK